MAAGGGEGRLGTVSKAFGLLATLLAVLGYASERAHLNAMGLTSFEPWPVERYLAASWALLTHLALRYSYLALAAGILIVAARVLVTLPQRKRARELAVRLHGGEVEVVAVLVWSLALVLSFARDASFDLAVGVLDGSHPHLTAPPVWIADMSLAVGAWAALAAYRRDARERAARGILAIASVLSLTLFALAYGCFARPSLYPRVRFMRDTEVRCGLLVGATDERVEVWTATRTDEGIAEGAVLQLRREDLSQLAAVDVIDLRSAVARLAGDPDDVCASLAHLAHPEGR